MKQIIGTIFQWAWLWNIPVSVAISIVAAREGAKDVFPKKTITYCVFYGVCMLALLACYSLP